MSQAQPSEKRELANAAYVWRIRCQTDLVDVANRQSSKFEDVEYAFIRYKRACEREAELEEVAKAEQETKQ